MLHEYNVFLPSSGRMTKYMTSDDKKGRNHFWRDASKHARRLHWALDAAIRYPPGEDRAQAYLDDYQREFGGSIPYWAQ